MNNRLYVIIPCFNEEAVLPISIPAILESLKELIDKDKLSSESRILLVDDGSTDNTWNIIKNFSQQSSICAGISLSKNKGHQNALLAGLSVAASIADFTISMDCDGQDDFNTIEKMIDLYYAGNDIVYGVREDRSSDSYFKRITAQLFYKVMRRLGNETVYNHADFRLLSKKVVDELLRFPEVNLYLRGLIPTVGFKSTTVKYTRIKRQSGHSHYSLSKMVDLASNGITSFSILPLRIIGFFGSFISVLFFVITILAFLFTLKGNEKAFYLLLISIVCFLNGCILVSIGIVGEYVGKINFEVKRRPRYIIAERTENLINKE